MADMVKFKHFLKHSLIFAMRLMRCYSLLSNVQYAPYLGFTDPKLLRNDVIVMLCLITH